jgi:hypothetical protein
MDPVTQPLPVKNKLSSLLSYIFSYVQNIIGKKPKRCVLNALPLSKTVVFLRVWIARLVKKW